MMKKLSELGISPAPWRIVDSYQFPEGGEWVSVIEASNKKTVSVPTFYNARLIAAAPKLYEVCYRIERWEDYAKAHNKVIESWSDIMHDLHKALAEAAGEEVDDGQSS